MVKEFDAGRFTLQTIVIFTIVHSYHINKERMDYIKYEEIIFRLFGSLYLFSYVKNTGGCGFGTDFSFSNID